MEQPITCRFDCTAGLWLWILGLLGIVHACPFSMVTCTWADEPEKKTRASVFRLQLGCFGWAFHF